MNRKESNTSEADTEKELSKPAWIRVRLPSAEKYARIKELKEGKCLHTVCEEARCPNIGECWEKGNATFLILGDICTRNCHFCAVKGGTPSTVDMEEPERVAQAVASMNLKHVVVTSVTRDDLSDGGAAVFAESVRQIRDQTSRCTIEVLIPDLGGSRDALQTVLAARPEILGHNVETVPRLYPDVRPQAVYQRSLDLLRTAKDIDAEMLTKSGIMVGIGEAMDEVIEVMQDLRGVGCDIFTIGQYLRPTKAHLPVVRYYTPEEFADLSEEGKNMGFRWVESGPLVRSSYLADAQAERLGVQRAD
jgi:lipoic acid synthetase